MSTNYRVTIGGGHSSGWARVMAVSCGWRPRLMVGMKKEIVLTSK